MNSHQVNLSELSRAELEQGLLNLQGARNGDSIGELQETVSDLLVQQIELEMQNRALREAQIENQQASERYALLYDRLPIGYLTVSPHGRIIEANLRAAVWLQTNRPAIVGVYLRTFVDSDDALRLSAHLQSSTQSDAELTLEIVLRPGDGSSRPVQLSSQRAVSGDGSIQVHIAMTDMSALKQTQRNMESFNRELEVLNSSISHDLRGPLVTIGNFASIVLSEHSEGLSNPGKEMVQRMSNAAVRMVDTLKQLHDYSCLTRLPMNFQVVSLENVVREILLENRALIMIRRAEIEVAHPLPDVRGLLSIVNLVLRNLLGNALKYCSPAEPPRIAVSASAHDSTVVLKVTDHGIGIDPRFHELIFKPFERLHPVANYPGAGLGLAIVRRAVDRMNGRVWLRSEEGRGSTFFVQLPKA